MVAYSPALAQDELLSLPALELAALLRRRTVSSEELVRRSLARIDRYDRRFQAFVCLLSGSALRAAAKIDHEARRGDPDARPLFSGIPTAVKDLNLLRGAFARMGTPAFRYLWSPVDDVTVSALRRGGFVFVGKTTTSELAIMPVTEPRSHPPTRNPWDESRSSGGSSGGAGAAVAASFVPVAQGSDGAGSIRIPASFCGLVGHKASAGLLPNPHQRMDPLSMTTNGALCRTVEDAAAMLDVLVGRRPGTPGTFLDACRRPPPRLLIRVSVAPPLGATSPAIALVVERVAAVLASLGHTVEGLGSVSGTLEEFLPIYQRMVGATPLLADRHLQPITRWLRDAGRRLTDQDARAARDALAARTNAYFGDADVVLTPTVPVAPPKIGAFDELPAAEGFARAAVLGAFTAPGNITGRPALSVPAGLVDGLPVGVQLIGKVGADRVVLALGRVLEQAVQSQFPLESTIG